MYETVRRIRRLEVEQERASATPIVTLSANVGVLDPQQCVAEGMNELLGRQPSLQTLRRTLDRSSPTQWRPSRKTEAGFSKP